MKKILSLIFSTLLAISARANNYYFSNAGNDSYSTVQAQNQATPWQTLSKYNSTTFLSGDTIYLKRGDLFYGTISVWVDWFFIKILVRNHLL